MPHIHREYDAVIIGGGHNGLVCGAYLAKAGKKVCIVERRDVLGGAACTEELWPGFKVSPCAYVISLFQRQIVKDLRLKEHGLRILPRTPSSFTPDLNGPGITLGVALPNTDYKEIAHYSKDDAKAYGEYEETLTRIAEKLEPIIAQPAPNLFAKHRRLFPKIREFWRASRLVKQMQSLGDDIPEAIELLTGDAATILNRWFKSDILKATLATDAIIGSFTSPYNPGSAYVLLHHVMGDIGGARGVWGYVQGGMGQLSETIHRAALRSSPEFDVRIGTGATKIMTGYVQDQGESAYGVMTEGGRLISGRTVISSIDANNTFNRLLTSKRILPPAFQKQVKQIDYSSASAKLNFALSGLPKFVNQKDDGVYNGTIHISPSFGYIEEAYHDARMGRPSKNPVLEITIPSAVDETIAPPGKHIMSVFIQYAPYELSSGSWEEEGFRDAFIERCLAVLELYAPGFKKLILHQQFLSPLDLEKQFGLTGGNIFQGAMTIPQMHMLRPVIGWADHRTPVRGLYMCGAATHPGGGVMGVCGKNAAKVVLSDL